MKYSVVLKMAGTTTGHDGLGRNKRKTGVGDGVMVNSDLPLLAKKLEVEP